VKSFEANEKQEETKKKLKNLAREDAKVGRKPQFVNKCTILIPNKRLINMLNNLFF
jgi:hypothetical protein